MPLEPTILIVDDDRISRAAMLRILGDSYKVMLAENGVAALTFLGERIPHAIVSDVEMPVMNGIELTRVVKSKRHLREVPVILVTSHQKRSAITRCFDAGADDYLPKPIDAKEFRARVGAAVRARQLSQELEETQRRLVKASRQAGEAEAAIGILHTIGNVLNNVNISAKLLQEAVTPSCEIKLGQVAELLEQHHGALSSAMGQKADLLVEYCQVLAEAQRHHRMELNEELARLLRHLDHARVVVSSQKRFASTERPAQEIDTKRLIESAERMVGETALAAAGYHKDVRCTSFYGDEHCVLEILVNLMRNALEAVAASPEPRVVLKCSVAQVADGRRVVFTLQDNGVGIPPLQLERIFEHGYTTKAERHGFGLHWAANGAREINGSLEAHSDGPGSGACFVLTIPEPADPERAMSGTTTASYKESAA